MSILIVASPTLSPLSTASPLPTDDWPQWVACERCGEFTLEADDWRCSSCGMASPAADCGPFPRTVAVWSEVEWPDEEAEGPCIGGDYCGETTNGWFPSGSHGPGWYCGWCEAIPDATSPGGAVTHTVAVTGPSHHADECEPGGWCGKEASWSDAWHTPTDPTSIVTLDTPVPCEQPRALRQAGRGPVTEPASVWTDDTVTATLAATETAS